MCLMQLLFELRPNLAHKYSKIFSFACAHADISAFEGEFLAHICFKSVRKNFQVQLIKFFDLLSKKSQFFTKSARARTFAQIPSNPKNAYNIHNSEFACKKSASYDNSKLCLTTV